MPLRQRGGGNGSSETAPAGQGAARTETASPPRSTAKRAEPGTVISTSAAEYGSEMEAKAHCPGETVVWANTRSKIYHFAGSRSYGNTKNGAYMCEKDTAPAASAPPGTRSGRNKLRRLRAGASASVEGAGSCLAPALSPQAPSVGAWPGTSAPSSSGVPLRMPVDLGSHRGKAGFDLGVARFDPSLISFPPWTLAYTRPVPGSAKLTAGIARTHLRRKSVFFSGASKAAGIDVFGPARGDVYLPEPIDIDKRFDVQDIQLVVRAEGDRFRPGALGDAIIEEFEMDTAYSCFPPR